MFDHCIRTAGRISLIERADGATPTIAGYAAVFYDPNDPGSEYRMAEDVVERIAPTAFDEAIKDNADVRALFNHDGNLILGRRSAGTLRLSVDRKGLRYEIDPPDTQAARDLLVSMRRGDVDGSSFRFVPSKTVYRRVGNLHILERTNLRLIELGPVWLPAYPSTEAFARSAQEILERARREIEALACEAARESFEASAAARSIILARAAKVESAIRVTGVNLAS